MHGSCPICPAGRHPLARLRARDVVDAVGAIEAGEGVDVVDAEIVIRVSAPIAKFTALVQMHAERGNTLRREETAEETMSAFSTSAGSHATSKSIASPTKVPWNGGE